MPESIVPLPQCGPLCCSWGLQLRRFQQQLRNALVRLGKALSPHGKVAKVPEADMVLAFDLSWGAGRPRQVSFACMMEGSGRHDSEPDEVTLSSAHPGHALQEVVHPFAGLILRDARLPYVEPAAQLPTPLGSSDVGSVEMYVVDEFIAKLLRLHRRAGTMFDIAGD